MNIGELTATLGVDDSSLMAASRKMYAYGDATKDVVRSNNIFLRQNMGIIKELQQHLDWLRDKQKNAFTVPELEYYNREIQQTKNILKEYEMVGVSSMTNVGNATKSFGAEIRDISYTLRILRSGIASVFALGGTLMVFKKGWEEYRDVMESTGETSRTFHETMTGVRFQMDEIKRSIATGNFGDFVDRLAQAAEHGRDLEEQLELVYNMSLQLKLVESNLNLEASKQLLIARNRLNSDQVREEAAKKYLALKQEIGVEEEKVAKQALKAALDASSVQASGLSPERIRWYADHAGAVEADREALGKYNEVQLEMQRLQYGINATQQEAERTDEQKALRLQYLRDELEKTDPLVKEMAKDYEKWMLITGTYEKPGDKQALIDAYSKLNDVLTKVNMGSSRMTMTLSQIMGKEIKDGILKRKDSPLQAMLDADEKNFSRIAAGYSHMIGKVEDLPKKGKQFGAFTSVEDYLGAVKDLGGPLSIIQADLANVALENGHFGNSMMLAADQARFLKQQIDDLRNHGITPSNDLMDAYIKKWRELEIQQMKTNGAFQVAKQGLNELASAFSNIKSMQDFGNALVQTAKNIILATITEAVAINTAKAVEQGKSWWGALIQGAAAMAATEALFSQIPKFAHGGEGTVPPGYSNDTYPMLLSSGEHYKITPAIERDSSSINGKVVFRISGYELVGMLEKQSRKDNIL